MSVLRLHYLRRRQLDRMNNGKNSSRSPIVSAWMSSARRPVC